MAELPPSTSADIARAARLQERYVREWLGAMVTGGIVTYGPDDQLYTLPPEHAALLTRRATPNNVAVSMQWGAVLGGVEDRIVECFRRGGGVHYHEFPRFHEVMAEESAQTVVATLVDALRHRPRPGGPRHGPPQHSSCGAPGRCLPHAGHRHPIAP